MLHVSGTHTVGMRLAMEAARVCMRTMGERQIRTDTTLLQHYTTLKRIAHTNGREQFYNVCVVFG
jgi:hypothetical protein